MILNNTADFTILTKTSSTSIASSSTQSGKLPFSTRKTNAMANDIRTEPLLCCASHVFMDKCKWVFVWGQKSPLTTTAMFFKEPSWANNKHHLTNIGQSSEKVALDIFRQINIFGIIIAISFWNRNWLFSLWSVMCFVFHPTWAHKRTNLTFLWALYLAYTIW